MGIAVKRGYPAVEEKAGLPIYHWDLICDQCGEVIGGGLDEGTAVFARGPEPERNKMDEWKHPKSFPVYWVHHRCREEWLSSNGGTDEQFIRVPADRALAEFLGRTSITILLSRMWEATVSKARGGTLTRARRKDGKPPEFSVIDDRSFESD